MKIAIKILVILLIFASILLYLANYMLGVAVTPSSDRRHQLDSTEARVFNKYPEMREWRDSLIAKGNWRDTMLLAEDGTRRHALILQQDSLATGSSVVMHGYDDNAVVMMRYYFMHYEVLGRNVIVPEHFNHGLSDGDHIRFGWKDRKDIAGLWIPLAHELWPEQQMIVHGLSMGGALTMFTSGEELADSLNIAGYIEDCGYSSTWDQLAYQLKEEYGLPSWPLLDVASWLCEKRYGWNFKESDAISQLKKCKKPMFFIHGDADDFVPTEMVYRNYDAHPGYKELWIVPGAAHARSIHEAWEEYVDKCAAFIAKVEDM